MKTTDPDIRGQQRLNNYSRALQRVTSTIQLTEQRPIKRTGTARADTRFEPHIGNFIWRIACKKSNHPFTNWTLRAFFLQLAEQQNN